MNCTENKWWLNEPWRMIQTNLRQTDMAQIDAETYVRQLQSFGATVAMINVGGILANYHTKVQDHPINPYLTGDPLDKVIRACRDAGIRVIARMDFSKIRREVYERHPDWAYRDPNGQIVDYNGNIHACPCGGFQQEKAFEITQEALTLFPVDGMFINMGGFNVRDYSYRYHGICHCKACQRKFDEMFGLPLPDREDPQDPVYRKYKIFQKRILQDQNHRLAEMVHSIRPGLALQGVDFMRVESNTEYGRTQWVYSSSSAVRSYQTLAGIPCSNPSVDFIGYGYRHTAVSPAQQSLRMWQTLANLGHLDYYIMGLLEHHEDRSGYEAIRNVFRFHQQHENVFRGMKLQGDALVLHSAGYAVSEEGRGWVRALTENHIPLHEGPPDCLTPGCLARYQAVIVADQTELGSEAVEILDDYVRNGGCLIVTGETGRWDESGNARGHIPFACLGQPAVLQVRRDMMSALFHLRATEHELFPFMKDAELFFFGEEYVYTEPIPGEACLQLIPPHRYGPPELCYYTQVTELPGLVRTRYGQGQAIYIPWKPGKLYWKEGYANTGAFLHGVLTRVAGLMPIADKTLSPMVEVTVSKDEQGRTLVQMVNSSGFWGNSFFEPLPVRLVTLQIPAQEQPGTVKSLQQGASIPFTWSDGVLHLTLPELKEYDALLMQPRRNQP